MTTPTPSKFNLLSVNETGAVELTGQQKLINLAKMDLLESLDKDNKMINRNICSFALYENRKANAKGNTEIPQGKLNIKGKEIDLDNEKYKDIKLQYQKASVTSPEMGETTDGNLAKLDTLFAEMLILDSGNMIEFGPQDSYGSGRTAEQESKKAYEELSKMDEYKDKIERAKKVLGDETHFVVKWTEEQMKMLDRIKNIADKIQGELPVIGAANEIEQKKSALLEEPKADEPTTSETEQPAEIEKEIPTPDGRRIKIKLTGKETPDEIIKKVTDAFAADKAEQDAHRETNKESVENIDLGLLVNRDNLADNIKNLRTSTGYPTGSLEIRAGVSVDIEKQSRFEEFKQKYIEAGDNELRKKDLDTQFAEHIILNNPPEAAIDKKYYIQINNDEPGKDTKTEKELEKEALKCRDSLQNAGYDVEYIRHEKIEKEVKEDESKKRELAEMKVEIGIITNKIAELQAELDSKRLHHTEIERVAKQEELRKLKQKLADLQGDYDKLAKEVTITIDKKKVYHIVRQKKGNDPIPVPVPEEVEDLEMNAVISDMGTNVHRERVSFETEEELRHEYKGTPRYNMPKKAYLWLSRGAKRKRKIREKMKAMAGKAFSVTGDPARDAALNDKTGDASERHDVELQNNLDAVQKANAVSFQNPQVNDLCKRYLQGTVTAAQFETQFNTIIDADAAIQAVLKGQKITHIGTNILLKLDLQRARWGLEQLVASELTAYASDNNQSHIDAINVAIRAHIKHNQENPKFMKDYEDFLKKTPGSLNKLQQYLKHQGAVMQMQVTNLKMNIDILVKGKSAYQIDNKDRQKGRAYKTGKFLDKLPRWVQTAGFVGVSVGTGLLTGGLGTVAAAVITTGVTASSVGFLNAIKKWTHYTKEQNTHEKDMVTDYRKEQAKLKKRQDQALNGKRYQWKTYKARRQLALYDQTTQENMFISDTMADTITDLSSKVGTLTPEEQNYMKKNLIQGWARLRYYREIGHNFIASNDKEKIEKDMKRLEKAIILGAGKLGRTLTDIETMQATDDNGANLTYATVQKDLKSSYDKSLIQFKRERRRLAAKYGIGTAALSAGMSIGMQYLLGTGIFSDKGTPGVDGQTATVNSHDHFDLGKASLLDDSTKSHIYHTASDILKDPRVVDGSTITLNYGAGTDATHVIAGRLTPAVYQAKLTAITDHINSMHLTPATKSGLISYINNHPREQSWATQNFTNDALHGMRVAEIIETNAQALADAGRTDFIFHLNYDPKLDVVGTGIRNATERVANCTYTVQTPSVPGTDPSSRGKFLQFPVFFNTFEDVDKKEKKTKKKNEKPKPNENPQTPIIPLANNPQTPPVRPTTKVPGIKDKRKHYGGLPEMGPGKTGEDDPVGGAERDPKTGKWKPITPIYPDSKLGVSTRKEKLNTDIEDFSPEYPVAFKEKTLDELAQIVLSHPNIALYEDPAFMNDSREAKRLWDSGDRKGAINEIKRIIRQEREYIRQELDKNKEYLNEVYGAIEKTFEKYNVKEMFKTLPSKKNIHIMCKYEFEAYDPRPQQDGGTRVGVRYSTNGHIMINYDYLHMRGQSPEMIKNMLQDVIVHELIHDSGVNNYHHFYTLKDKNKPGTDPSNRENEQFITRRVGLMLLKKMKGNDGFLGYGRLLNEAVTQMLADEICKDLLPDSYQTLGYPKEKEIVRLLENKFNIPFEMFAKAILNRTRDGDGESNTLRALNEKINGFQNVDGQKGFERPEFLKLIMCIMDYESENKSFDQDYSITKALINGEQVMLTPTMKAGLHPSLLLRNKTGMLIRSADGHPFLKQGIRDAYPNLLDPEAYAATA